MYYINVSSFKTHSWAETRIKTRAPSLYLERYCMPSSGFHCPCGRRADAGDTGEVPSLSHLLKFWLDFHVVLNCFARKPHAWLITRSCIISEFPIWICFTGLRVADSSLNWATENSELVGYIEEESMNLNIKIMTIRNNFITLHVLNWVRLKYHSTGG